MWRSKAWKWLMVGSAITIIALYLLEMTTLGIERVNGPFEEQKVTAAELSSLNEPKDKPGLLPIQDVSTYDNSRLEQLTREMIEAEEQLLSNKLSFSTRPSKIDDEIAKLEAEILELKRLALLKEKEQLQQQLLLNENADKPAVNRMADSTSGVLQEASSSSLQFIAQLFSKVID